MVVVLVIGAPYCDFLSVFQFFQQRAFKLGRIGNSQLPEELFKFRFPEQQIDLLVDYLTQHYNEEIVVDCLGLSLELLLTFKEKRPYFYTIYVDAPPVLRYQNYFNACQLEKLRINDENVEQPSQPALTLESFLQQEQADFYAVRQAKYIRWILLGQQTAQDILSDIQFKEEVRPSWDRYFMQLARYTSSRSNCMKKKVGCIVEKNHRVIAAGYNGTPYPMKNCNDGGCPRCNNPEIRGGQRLEECFCIHAEENALLECGKTAKDATLYCSTCPCIGCAKKIVQVGIARVFYSDTFHMDAITHFIFQEAKIEIRQFKYE